MPGPEVVVVGGGVMGAAAAWRLAARGASVILLEQFGPGHERGASHGSSRIFRLAYDRVDYVELARRSLSGWRALEAETGRRVLTTTGGVDHGDRAQLHALRSALQAAGVPSELLHPSAAEARWPGLRFDGEVLHQPDAGRLHADRAVAALTAAAASLGADVRHRTSVTEIEAGPDPGVRTAAGEAIGADHVVVAAGAWTRTLLDGTALPPLRVTLEQPAHFRPRDPAAPWPSFIHHPGAGLPGDAAVYGLASDDGVKVGFHKTGAPFDPDEEARPVDAERVAALQDYARRWLPGVDAASAEALTCTYTLTPDEHFVVDRDGGVTVLAGFSGHGFKFAPAIGDLAADLALDGSPPPPAFALGGRTAAPAPPVIR